MIEMEDHTNDLSEGRIPFLDYKTYTDRVFFLPSKDGANDVMITGKLNIPKSRKATVAQALNQFSNLLNSKTFLITVRQCFRSHTLTNSHIHTSDYIWLFSFSFFGPKQFASAFFFLWQSDFICLPGGSSHQLRLIPWTKSFDHWASTTKILHSTSNPVFNLRSCLITPCQ